MTEIFDFNSKSELRYACKYCSNSYMRKDSLNRHMVYCAFNSKKVRNKECECDAGDIPNISDLYSIVVDLSLKYDKLQLDYDKLSKWVQQKKRKINIVDYLNENCKVDISHDQWLDKVVLTKRHLEHLFSTDSIEAIISILEEFIALDNTIRAFDHKENVLFVYDKIADGRVGHDNGDHDQGPTWHIMTGEEFQKTVRCISLKIMGLFKDWQDENMDKMDDETFSRTYITNLKKVMGKVDLNVQYNKIHCKLYKSLKTNVKNVMYEFE